MLAVLNALKFLSNPLILLSVLLAGSLAFGGCQSRRIKGYQAQAKEAKAAIVRLEAEGKVSRDNLKAAQADLAATAGALNAANSELIACQNVRAKVEAEQKAALAASERAKRDAERTLSTFMDRYARAYRNPSCRALLDTPVCVE